MKKSAGIVLFRKKGDSVEFFLVHPGGPFWKGKDKGAWSIPKGEFTDEEPLQAATREFQEETGKEIQGKFIELSPTRLKSGKWVYAWAVEGDLDLESIVSNTFTIEWPYKSGKRQTFPEIDKAGWFTLEKAIELINAAQVPLLNDLMSKLK
ncbi:MAG TPA: NUDIX domain-containing protein [Flavisolibacter sp.]